MKYIAYFVPEIVNDEIVKLSYQCVPHSQSAIRELDRIGAQILGEYSTVNQCMLRSEQHSIALDGMQCLN
jgi:hypothetical protein